jgi:branched-chain amino acid aminotransferase
VSGGLRVWLNGAVLPLARARIPVFDRGLLFGDGVYETVRAYGGRPFRLGRHLARLAGSASRLGFRLEGGALRLVRAIDATLAANRLAEARIRIVVTRGTGAPDLGDIAAARHPTVLVYALPYMAPPPAAYRDGVPAVIPAVVRNDRRALDPAIKSLNLLNNFLAGKAARQAGAREAIMLNPQGFVAEAASANVFFVRRGVLLTPAPGAGILAGVTRELVLDLARRLGMRVREGFFRAPALVGADEAFVTASTIEILPLATIGRRRFPRLRPVTRALMAAYRVTVRGELGNPSA